MPGLLRCRFRSPLFQERTPAQSQPLLKFLLSRIYLPSLVVLTPTRNLREQRTEQFSAAETRNRRGFEPSCHRNCLMVKQKAADEQADPEEGDREGGDRKANREKGRNR